MCGNYTVFRRASYLTVVRSSLLNSLRKSTDCWELSQLRRLLTTRKRMARRKYDIPEGTLRNRYNGCTQSATKAYTHQKLMGDSQEEVLVDWMIFIGVTGRPISRTTLRPKCVEICGRLPGKTWIWRFLKRHPEVNLKKGSGLDAKRAQAFNYLEVKTYFEKLMKVI